MDDPLAARRRFDPDDDAALTALARQEVSRRPRDIPSITLLILCVLAIFYTLYFTGELLLPIVLAAMIKMLLQPAMRVLTQRLRLPPVLAALCMVAALLGGIGALGFSVAGPAAHWLGQAPRSLSVIEDRLEFVRQPIEIVQRATKRLESLAVTRESEPAVAVQEPGIGSSIFRGTRTVLSQAVTLFVMLFFLLAAGDTLLRRLVEILPSATRSARSRSSTKSSTTSRSIW
ncbi:MAG: AI-2E family transporter [Pseudomonadota bacterium]